MSLSIDEKYQSEKALEEKMIQQLVADGYEEVTIHDEVALRENFKVQINKHNLNKYFNGKPLSNTEFERLLAVISGKSVFASAEILRNIQNINRDDGTEVYVELFNRKEWCQNEFQVTRQITDIGKYETRYDVTLLVNGLPLVQIELKRRGIDFKEAFNQICRYKKHSLTGLFRFVQFFVISNGIDTKYFANGDGDLSFQYTFYWSDLENNRCSNLQDFTMYFLPKCWVSKMISRYMILDKDAKSLIIMRPYQVFAVESLLDRAEGNHNGYVWHTTGSGKTLTSFKLASLLKAQSGIAKVIFLVDRKDLDGQTLSEFNRFEEGSVSATEDVDMLLKHLKDPSEKLILTTIQKMSNVCKLVLSKDDRAKIRKTDVVEIKNDENKVKAMKSAMEDLKGKKIVFIIDECHRSQFGDMHKAIELAFKDKYQTQYFGFTGTPRFKDNPSQDGRTTTDIFGEEAHHYLIKDAIKDGNVLGFNVDYIKTINTTYNEDDDSKVEAIDTEEVLMANERLTNVCKNILKIHHLKTVNQKYNAIFATKNIESLIKYYDLFKEYNTQKLKIAAIFTFDQNEDLESKSEHSRDSLERIIDDYNKMFGTKYNTSTFDAYFKDVTKRVKYNEIDILIVVNMFLTGFDAKFLNTLYVDKRLKNHDLIQAFSRTNRVESITKPYGNIVCYQTSKKAVDSAIMLFSNSDNTEGILMKDMDHYIHKFRKSYGELLDYAPTPDSIELGGDELNNKKFVICFRDMLKNLERLNTFIEFTFNKEVLGLDKQTFEDYKSKYLALSREQHTSKQKISILADIDFCIELIVNNKINVQYILNLLKEIAKVEKKEEKEKNIKDLLVMIDQSTDDNFYSKLDLIKAFITRVSPVLTPDMEIDDEYNKFMEEQRIKEINDTADYFGLTPERIEEYIKEYEFGGILEPDTIKQDLNKEKIQEIKEKENIPTVIKTKKSIAQRIIGFVKNTIIRFLQ